jgi:hypothetical protein
MATRQHGHAWNREGNMLTLRVNMAPDNFLAPVNFMTPVNSLAGMEHDEQV